MPVTFTDNGKRFSTVFKRNDTENQTLFFDKVVVRETVDTVYQLGQVLGTVTATGKAKVAKKAAADGSEVASGIFAGDALGQPAVGTITIPANTDVTVLVLVRGKYEVNEQGLVYDASYATAADKTAAMAALAAKGVIRVSEVGNAVI